MSDEQRADSLVERIAAIGRKPKTHSASDLVHRFAKIVREHERDGVFQLEGKDGMEMARICRGCRKYLEICGIVALPRCKLPSEFASAFADLISSKDADDKMRREDVVGGQPYHWLTNIIQAMRNYARTFLTFDLLRNRRLMASVAKGGRMETTL